MSAVIPCRRLTPRCLSCTSTVLPLRPSHPPSRLLHQTGRRAAHDESSKPKPKTTNPFVEDFMRQNPDLHPDQQPAIQARKQQEMAASMRKRGDLASSSVFEDERRAQYQFEAEEPSPDESSSTSPDAFSSQKSPAKVGRKDTRDPSRMQRVLDPDPNARERWERKKVIQLVRKRGRVTRAQFLKRTEREHLLKSHNLKTSVKKLGMLARQIAGKNVDDAITQMRFSKKKVAKEVLQQLVLARDEAVVMRGMGLGSVEEAGSTDVEPSSTTSTPDSPAEPLETSKPTPRIPKRLREGTHIRLKSGSRHLVTDPTRLYIDQAWVGRGPYGKLPEFRARGRVNILRPPWTSISFLLKEEATRVREYAEREAKRLRRRTERLWVPLPDRPITGPAGSGQWFSW